MKTRIRRHLETAKHISSVTPRTPTTHLGGGIASTSNAANPAVGNASSSVLVSCPVTLSVADHLLRVEREMTLEPMRGGDNLLDDMVVDEDGIRGADGDYIEYSAGVDSQLRGMQRLVELLNEDGQAGAITFEQYQDAEDEEGRKDATVSELMK